MGRDLRVTMRNVLNEVQNMIFSHNDKKGSCVYFCYFKGLK